MSIELFISSSPHETKVAVLEDDQLVEVYYQRDTDVGLVGGIYKGRVNRVLPGMQSAFVDIGLERDAFLHVSDLFLEDQEEYDKILDEAEASAVRFAVEKTPAVEEKPAGAVPTIQAESVIPLPVVAATPEASAPPPAQPVSPGRPAESQGAGDSSRAPAGAGPAPLRYSRESSGYRRPERGGRHRRHRGRGFEERPLSVKPQGSANPSFEILPGESLAKYSHATPSSQPPTPSTFTTGSEKGAGIAPPSGSAVTPSPVISTFTETALPPPAPVRPTEKDAQPVAPPQEALPPVARVEDTHLSPPPNETPSAAQPTGRVDAPPPIAANSGTPLPRAPEVPWTGGLAEKPASLVEAGPGLPPEPNVASESTPPPQSEVSPQDDIRGEAPLGPAPYDEGPAESGAGQVSPEMAPAEISSIPPSVPPPAVTSAPGEASREPSERTYTLREPSQQPHYAPRRGRRGRRGPGRPPHRAEGRQESYRPAPPPRQITELLKEGQEILVQIAKEPLGTKGARVTSHIALPGRYLVYMPTIDHIGVSRKIASEQERLRLRNQILENKGALTGGFIVRTAGEGRSEEDLKADLKFLSTLWSEIHAKTERAQSPALIHRDLDLVQRILRDILTPEFKSIRIDSEVEYERVVDFVSRCQPSLIGHVKLYARDTPIFEEFGIEAEIEKALRSKVWLKSGGYIVINQTEALVAIDVNTGKYVGKTNRLEDTIVKTNVDAVQEIVRQIRLRDLGGIIVIDFIDMDERRNRMKVGQALEDALRHDRAPTKVISFHDFGLVAITRKRVKQSLERTLCEPCNYCTGSGWIKSVTTVCYEILAEARKMATQIEGSALNLRVNPEVAKALKSREGTLISELESLTHKDVIVRSDPTVHQERFEIY